MRLLADENFNGEIIRGLLLRKPDLDIITAQDAGLAGFIDPELLQWAAANNRIILTHDRATMPKYAYEHLAQHLLMPGLFILSNRFPVGGAIQELLLVIESSQHAEWDSRVIYLPL